MANLGPNIVLNNPFAGVTDFGTVTDVFSGENETTETVRPATALEYIARNVDPAHPLYQALIGHSSTSITPYTDVNGNQFYHIAGKTGGPNRERYAQMYAVQGDQLIPVGEGQFYKGEHPDQAFKDFLGVAAGLIAAPVLGPYASAIGNALGITNAAIAQAVGQGIINTSVQVAQGVPIADALKQNIVASVIPNAVGNPIIDNAIRAAASARLMGGDVEKAVTNSLIASGVQSAASDVSITGDRTVDSGLVSGATSSLQAAVTGGDIGQSFIQGYVRGSSTAINQDEARAQRAASGAGFVGEAPFELGGVTLDTTVGGQQTTVAGGGVIAEPGITTLGDLIVRLDNGETIDLGQTPLPTGEVGALRISMSRTSGQGEINPLAVAQQTAKQRTVSPQQASDEMLTPIAQYFQIPNGSTFVRDLRNGQITEVVGEGAATKIGGGALNLNFTTVGRVEGVPSNAQYAGVLYTTDLDAATDPYANFSNIDVSTLSLTRGFDPNVGMPGNLERIVNSDGSVVQIDKRFGDRSYFSPDGTLFDSYKTTYSKVNDIANTLASIATSAPGEWSESVANGLKVLGIPTDKLAAAADKLNQYGTNIAPAQVNALQAQWVRDVQDAVARNNYGREASDGVNLAKEIYNITLDNPIGGFTLVGKEIFQEAPEAAIGGVAGFAGKVAGMMGTVVSQVLESAGGTYKESIQRIEDEIQRGFRAPMSRQEIEAEARTNATKGGGITALLTALTPGGRTVTGAVRNEMATEGLETYLTARATGQSHEAAMQDAVVSGTIAGKVVGSMYAGDVASQKLGNLTGTQPGTGVGAAQQITINGAKIGRIAGLDDTGELVFVVTDDGNQLTIPSVNVLNNDTSREGQSVLLNNNNQIVANADARSQLPTISPQGIAVIPTGGASVTPGAGTPTGGTPTGVTPTGGTPTGVTPTGGMSTLGMQNLLASSQYGQGAQQTFGQPGQQVQQPAGGQLTGVTPATAGGTQLTAPAQGGGTRPATDTTVRPGQSEADLQQQARLAAEQDIANRTYKGQVYATAEEAAQARLADTAPTTRSTPAYSANVAATPEVVAELLALKGLPASEGTIRILMTGNPTIAQVGKEIEILAQMRRDQQPTVAATQQPTGTPSVVTGQQTGPTIVTNAAQQTQPVTTPTVTPTVTPTTTETINLTFDPGRVNIDTLEDTVTAVDTVGAVDTVRAVDTTPTFDTVAQDTLPQDTLPQDTVPTYGEDEDIIRFLGLDQQPTPTTPEITPAVEDTIGGGVGGGAVDVTQEEQLAVAPKAVYTPRPGTRVVDTGTSTGILPTRVQLSEGMGDDVEGTGEEEQQPVWNVRSLKLRRALGI